MLLRARLSDIDGEKLVGINHHNKVPPVNGMETASGLDFCLLSSHCPHPCPPALVVVCSTLAAHCNPLETWKNY